jgi:acetyl-CoA carboxylase, biotin carboxylase subunit
MTVMSPATGGQGPAPPAAWMACVHTRAFPGAVGGPDYDSLLAKIIAWGQDRDQALAGLRRALRELRLAGQGIRTTAPLLADLLDAPVFRAARHDMEMLDHQTAAAG